jgi:PAS domain S-box-containing protein
MGIGDYGDKGMNSTHILIVEDEIIFAADLKGTLESYGYIVDSVVTGEAAIAHAKEQRPDLVVMDILLGGKIDGIQAAEMIRTTCNIPVIYLTAYADDTILNRARITEPYGYILKPFFEREIRPAIEIALYKHKLDESLRQSEERFRSLSDLFPIVIFEMDTAGKMTYINRFGRELFGLTETDVLKGVFSTQFVVSEDHARISQKLSRVAAGERSAGESYTFVTKGGVRMRAIAIVSPIMTGAIVTGFRGGIFDITERLNLEEALKLSEEKYRALTENLPDITFSTDLKGILTYIAPQVNQYGYLPEEIMGRPIFDLIPFDDRKAVADEFTRQLTERSVFTATFRIPDVWGNTHWFEAKSYLQLDEFGERQSVYGMLRDITERLNLEEALKQSEKKYRALTENMPDITFSTDLKGILTYVSPQVNQYGYLPEEITGKPIFDLIHLEDRRKVADGFALQLTEQSVFTATFRMLDVWGNTHWFEAKSYLQLDEYGESQSVYGMLRDITERRNAEDAIELANKKLNLMNNITRHDITNTITGLIGCVDMAQATASPEERSQLLGDIKTLVRVIQRQIDFTKQYQEVGVNLPQWQNVDKLIRKVLVNFSDSGIAFEIDTKDENIEIYADPLLEKVFYNLIDNALRYGEKARSIRFYFVIYDKGLSLICEDDGTGVPADMKEKIFERGIGQNTGMGLFLSREILSITRIEIQENGMPGKGARFEISIPRGGFRFAR